MDYTETYDQHHTAGENSFTFHSDDAGHEELDAHYDHSLTSYPTGDSTPPTGTISWGSTGSGHQTGNITGEFSSSVAESGDPPFTFTVSGDYLSQATNTYDYTGAWTQVSGELPEGSSLDTTQYQFSWYGTHTENGSGWNDGDSYDGTGASEQRWAGSRLQGATGYDEAALASLVPGVIGVGSAGIGGPSHAPPTIGFALPPGLGMGDDSSGGNQQNSPADEAVFENPPTAWGQYWAGVGQVFSGYGKAATGVVSGGYQMVRHPIQTAGALISAASNLRVTVSAIIDECKEKSQTLEGQGELAADLMMMFAPAAALKAVSKTGTLAKLSSNLGKLGKSIVGKIDDVVGKGKSVTASANRTVIGKLDDLAELRARENSLLQHLPDRGSTKANWQQNSRVLRTEMSKGIPIRDASVDAITGALKRNTGFLCAERELLMNHGWNYNPATQLWSPLL